MSHSVPLVVAVGAFIAGGLYVHRPSVELRPWFRSMFIALTVAWLSFLVILLCHGREIVASGQIARIYPEFAKPFFERQFNNACEVRLESVRAYLGGNGTLTTIISENIEGYVASHVLGWGLATVMVISDPLECFLISALHEVLEVWYEPIYPPFAECWWDKYILDMVGNAIGCFVLGPLVAKLLGIRFCQYPSIGPRLGMYFTTIFNQAISFPLIFWLPHVLGIPPKHTVAVVHGYMLNLLYNMFVHQRIYQTVTGRAVFDRTPWELIVIPIFGLELVCVYVLNSSCSRPLQLDGFYFFVPILSWLVYAIYAFWVTARPWKPNKGH